LWTYVRDDRPAGDTAAPAVWFAYSPDRSGKGKAFSKSKVMCCCIMAAMKYTGFEPLLARFTRYGLPLLVVIPCLPSAALGSLWLISLVVSHFVDKSNPLLMVLFSFEYMAALVAGILGPIFVVAAFGIWIWLLAAGERIATKLWTAAFPLASIYGLYVLKSQFQVR
jgi:hypothetical protein